MTVGVLFDFHKTLVVTGSFDDWLRQGVAATGDVVDSDQFLPVLRQVWARAGRRHPGSAWDLDPAMHRRVFQEVLVEDSACPPRLAAALYDLMPEQWIAVPGAVDLLRTLTSSGVAVGLLSNTGLDLRPRLTELGLMDHLASVTLSFEEGLVKPDPAIFAVAATRLGVRPADCVYVGDTAATDGGAASAGMTCILVPLVDDVPRLPVASLMLAGLTPSRPA